jgi:chromosome segregation ATPase
METTTRGGELMAEVERLRGEHGQTVERRQEKSRQLTALQLRLTASRSDLESARATVAIDNEQSLEEQLATAQRELDATEQTLGLAAINAQLDSLASDKRILQSKFAQNHSLHHRRLMLC